MDRIFKTKGIGEILIQSIDDDGINGFDDNLLYQIKDLKINMPTVVGCEWKCKSL